MSDRIRLLDDSVISQIAAGEVIEAPFAVVKELCENSLDAGALSISVVIEAGGRGLVKVTDDGLGMSAVDLKMAFQRYTTSKIRTAEELSSVMTLGFRGEALASIATISRVEAISREHNSAEGAKIYIEGGEEKEFSPTGCVEGTAIAVRDLFFNTPARRKFLKSEQIEGRKCFQTFRSLSLAKPNVEWKFFQGEKLYCHLPPVDLQERIINLLGEEYSTNLLELGLIEGEFKISGFISKKSLLRHNREHQYLYLNGRRIIDRRLNNTIFNAYELMTDRNEYPSYIIFLELDPNLVDVNVHPTKSEVRFRAEKEINSFVYRALQGTLGIGGTVSAYSHKGYEHNLSYQQLRMGKKISIEDYKELFQPRVSGTLQDFKPLTLPLKEGEMEKGGDRFIPDKLFQLHDRYIIAQIKSGLVILDQHAAHERVLFEHSLSALTSGKISRQKLLFPRFLELTYGEDEIFEQMLPWLEKIGFDLVPVGPRLYQVETVPAGMKITDEIALLQEMLEYYSENDDRSIEPAERVCSAFACKAAIKAGEVLTPVEAVELIEALFRTGISHACPHGRPTYITLELRELEKRFGRS